MMARFPRRLHPPQTLRGAPPALPRALVVIATGFSSHNGAESSQQDLLGGYLRPLFGAMQL
eukprot:11903913-Alexandrium_andersonii.AAC.1